jgi:hypothetical protein
VETKIFEVICVTDRGVYADTVEATSSQEAMVLGKPKVDKMKRGKVEHYRVQLFC